jgi:hypothetical protein
MMKSQVLLISLTAGVLLAATACSAAAGKSDGAASGLEKLPAASQVGAPANPGAPRREARDPSGIIGQVVSVSEDEIALALAVMPELDKSPGPESSGDGSRPGGMKERPWEDSGGGAPGRPERPSGPGSDKPAGESGGDTPPGESGGDRRGPGGGMGMTFAEDATAYKLSDACVVTKGRGDPAETVGLESIAAKDIVSIELDDDGQVAAISILQMDAGAQPPQTPRKD